MSGTVAGAGTYVYYKTTDGFAGSAVINPELSVTTCTLCKGTGERTDSHGVHECEHCGGSGYLPKRPRANIHTFAR